MFMVFTIKAEATEKIISNSDMWYMQLFRCHKLHTSESITAMCYIQVQCIYNQYKLSWSSQLVLDQDLS